jgi:hypothetical protein
MLGREVSVPRTSRLWLFGLVGIAACDGAIGDGFMAAETGDATADATDVADSRDVPDSRDVADAGANAIDVGDEPMAREADSASDAAAGCLPERVTELGIASTPRADENLELLTLRVFRGDILAAQPLYDHIVRDMAAVRERRPDLASISFFPAHDGRTIVLTVSPATADRMESGAYDAWDCLNTTFGAKKPFEYLRAPNGGLVFVFIKLKGIYGIDALAPYYERLPDVRVANADGFGGDGPTICVTPAPPVWHYVLDAASGDCLSGCTHHSYTHFIAEGGSAWQLEEWSGSSGAVAPSWVDYYASPAVCR